MSWTIVVQKILEQTPTTKYKVTAFQKGEAGALSSELEINRDELLNYYYNLLPYISGIRFRSQALQELNPLRLLESIKNMLSISLGNDLKNVFDTAQSLHIITDDVDIPWEISGCDEAFKLKCSFGISRLSKRRFISPPKLLDTNSINILFIVDTKSNLPQTKIEAQKIIAMFDRINNRDHKNKNKKVGYVILEGKEASYNNVRKCLIQNYFDIIHACTHTEYDGIVLNDGLLHPQDIFDDIKIEAPWFVFMNSCESAKTKDLNIFETSGNLSDLNIAFLAAGVNSYIGTNCVINDAAASEIAVNFYNDLILGYTLGESLRNAKNKFYNNNMEDLSWLAFRLYGDPTSKKDFDDALAIVDEKDEISYRDTHNDKIQEDSLKNRIVEYIQKNKNFSISKCARDLEIDVDEIMDILSKL
jgi:hypothetical protein